jgi:hypothetical protein
MRWLRVRKADIEKNFRNHFEEFGVEIVRAYFTQPVGTPIWRDAGQSVTTVQDARQPMQFWLREQYDRAERKETWSLTMEIAITVFVAAELVMSIVGHLSK